MRKADVDGPPKEESFLDHLEELRRRIVFSLAAVALLAVAAYFFSKPLLQFLTLPLRRFTDAQLYFHTPAEAFLVHLAVAGLAGVVLASPVLLTQLWFFAAPGLYHREKQIVFPLIWVSVLLFLAGAAFGFWVLVPLGLQFFISFETESLRPLLGIGPYFSFLTGMVLASGIIFDAPVVVLGLVKLGVLDRGKLVRSRKIIIVLIFVIAAVLTPPDPGSQILLAIPLWALFELCVLCARCFEKKPKGEAL